MSLGPGDEKWLLIVDDEGDLRELLRLFFRSITPHILTAGDGVEALELIRTKVVATVISDIRMPRMDGIEFLKKARLVQPRLPFIILSSDREPRLQEEAHRLGALAFILKPFDPVRMKKLVQSAYHLGLGRLKEELPGGTGAKATAAL